MEIFFILFIVFIIIIAFSMYNNKIYKQIINLLHFDTLNNPQDYFKGNILQISSLYNNIYDTVFNSFDYLIDDNLSHGSDDNSSYDSDSYYSSYESDSYGTENDSKSHFKLQALSKEHNILTNNKYYNNGYSFVILHLTIEQLKKIIIFLEMSPTSLFITDPVVKDPITIYIDEGLILQYNDKLEELGININNRTYVCKNKYLDVGLSKRYYATFDANNNIKLKSFDYLLNDKDNDSYFSSSSINMQNIPSADLYNEYTSVDNYRDNFFKFREKTCHDISQKFDSVDKLATIRHASNWGNGKEIKDIYDELVKN